MEEVRLDFEVLVRNLQERLRKTMNILSQLITVQVQNSNWASFECRFASLPREPNYSACNVAFVVVVVLVLVLLVFVLVPGASSSSL